MLHSWWITESSRMSSSSSRCLIPMSFLFSFLVVVSAEQSEVEKECAKTPHPDLCVSCINSDTSRGTNDMSELTYEILFCMMSEATHGHEAADMLAQQTTEPNLLRALQTCNVSLFAASNDLTDSLMRMEGEDYGKAEADLISADKGVARCLEAFVKQPIVTNPPQLSSHVDLAARYYDVAHVFFALIPR